MPSVEVPSTSHEGGSYRLTFDNPAPGLQATNVEGMPAGMTGKTIGQLAAEQAPVQTRSQQIQETVITPRIPTTKPNAPYGYEQQPTFTPNESFGFVRVGIPTDTGTYYTQRRGYVTYKDVPAEHPQRTAYTVVTKYPTAFLTAKQTPTEVKGVLKANPQPTPVIADYKDYKPEFGMGFAERAQTEFPSALVNPGKQINLQPTGGRLFAETGRGAIIAFAGGLDILGEAVARPGKAVLSIPASVIGGVAQIPFQMGRGALDIGRGDLPAAYQEFSNVVTPLVVFKAAGATIGIAKDVSPIKYGTFGVELKGKGGGIETKTVWRGIYRNKEPYANVIFGRTETGAFVRGIPTPKQMPSLFDIERLNLPEGVTKSNVQVRPDSTLAAGIIANPKTLAGLNVKPEQASKITSIQSAFDVVLKGKNYPFEESSAKFTEGKIEFKLLAPETFKAVTGYMRTNKGYFEEVGGSTSSYPFTNPEFKLKPSDLEVYLTKSGVENKNLITQDLFKVMKPTESEGFKYELRTDDRGNPRIYSITKEQPQGEPSIDLRADLLTRNAPDDIRVFTFGNTPPSNLLKFGRNQQILFGRSRGYPAELVGGMPVLNIKSQLVIMGGQSLTMFKTFDEAAGKWRVIFEPPLQRGKDVVKFTEYGVSQTQGKLLSKQISLAEANKALIAFKTLERSEHLNLGTPGIKPPVTEMLAKMPKLYSLVSDKPPVALSKTGVGFAKENVGVFGRQPKGGDTLKFSLTEAILGKRTGLNPPKSGGAEYAGSLKLKGGGKEGYPKTAYTKTGLERGGYPSYPKGTKGGYPAYPTLKASYPSYPIGRPSYPTYPVGKPSYQELPYPTQNTYPVTTKYTSTPNYPTQGYPTTAYPKTPNYPGGYGGTNYPSTPTYPGGRIGEPPKTPPLTWAGGKTDRKERALSRGFALFIRRRGKFLQTPGVFTKETAIGLGAKIVSNTAAATFKIRPAGFTEPKNAPLPFARQKFYNPKTIRRGEGEELYTQLNKYRISSYGEKQEITQKGLATLRKNKKWF